MAKIIYVEDNESNILLVRKILESEKHTVYIAREGMEGIKLAKEVLPDLILMDMNLPDIDGKEATSIIKGDERIGEIPIIALTANVLSGSREKSLIAGCDGYIQKPIEMDNFIKKINEYLLGKKETVDDLQQREKLLREYNKQLTRKLEQNLEKNNEFSKLRAELELTKLLQRLLLPRDIPEHSGFDIAFSYTAAERLAGDYIDIIPLKNEILFSLFDVAGHGVSSAMVMTIMRSLVHSHIDKLGDPYFVIDLINNVLTTELMKQKYVTAALLYLNPNNNFCSFFRCGAVPLLTFKAKTEAFEHINPDGILLGAFDINTVFNEMDSKQFYCEAGDISILYSDGLVDLHYKNTDFFGEERLKDAIVRAKDFSSQKIADEINEAIVDFSKGRKLSDDISFIVIKKT